MEINTVHSVQKASYVSQNLTETFDSVNRAFSRQAKYFDESERNNIILADMRTQVRDHVMKFLKRGDYILELNAGTGLDAEYFVEQGFKVHATDLSDGMIQMLKQRIIHQNLSNSITFQQCSYTQLDQLNTSGFNYIFSNFGGLNCIKDLSQVTKFFSGVLKDQGFVTFVLMSKFCPWEFFSVFKGNFSHAFRRFKKNGAIAHLEGEYFKTYYFTPKKVLKSFGKKFKLIKVEGLGVLIPPPVKENVPKQQPKFYKVLKYLDKKLRNHFPFNRWADHFIITLQYSME